VDTGSREENASKQKSSLPGTGQAGVRPLFSHPDGFYRVFGRQTLLTCLVDLARFGGFLEHDPEKWIPVFRKDHAQTRRWPTSMIQRS
jgi:hypothetical protein